MLEKEQIPTALRVGQSCQESASAVHAVRLGMSDYGRRECALELSTSPADPPYDRTAIADGAVYWRYDEHWDATPALNPPDERVLKLVEGLARETFRLSGWYERAGGLARQLTARDAASLYACMVFPPRPDGLDITPWQWLLRVQYAAVCLLARLRTEQDGAASEAMRALWDRLPSPELARICLGQIDWPVIPALTLLAWQAETGIADGEIVYQVLSSLQKRVSKNGACFFEHALVCAMARLPGRDRAFYEEMRARRREMEEDV